MQNTDNFEDLLVNKVISKLKVESEDLKKESDMDDNKAFDVLKEPLPTENLVNTIDNISHESLDLEKISNELDTLKDLIIKYNTTKQQTEKVSTPQDINSLSSEEKIELLSNSIEDIKKQLNSFSFPNANNTDTTILNTINADEYSKVDSKNLIPAAVKTTDNPIDPRDSYILFLENKISELTKQPLYECLNDLKELDDSENIKFDEKSKEVLRAPKEDSFNDKNENEDLKIAKTKNEDIKKQTDKYLVKNLIEKIMAERGKNR